MQNSWRLSFFFDQKSKIWKKISYENHPRGIVPGLGFSIKFDPTTFCSQRRVSLGWKGGSKIFENFPKTSDFKSYKNHPRGIVAGRVLKTRPTADGYFDFPLTCGDLQYSSLVLSICFAFDLRKNDFPSSESAIQTSDKFSSRSGSGCLNSVFPKGSFLVTYNLTSCWVYYKRCLDFRYIYQVMNISTLFWTFQSSVR